MRESPLLDAEVYAKLGRQIIVGFVIVEVISFGSAVLFETLAFFYGQS